MEFEHIFEDLPLPAVGHATDRPVWVYSRSSGAHYTGHRHVEEVGGKYYCQDLLLVVLEL
jgi:hypothetical protein